jgi:hypothetical protein
MVKSTCKIRLVVIVLLSMFWSSCEKEDLVVKGMSPIYISYDDFSGIKSIAPMDFVNTGKIVNVNNYLFINEKDKGIHVVNNTNPNSPKNEYFWQILGNKEFTISGDVLYADNGKHLIVIDILDFSKIYVISSIKDVYEIEPIDEFPKSHIGWFECFKSNKGILIGWEEKQIVNPACKI